MNLAPAEASSTFLRILAVPSKQAFFNIWKRWLIALSYSLDLIFKFLILFHLLLFSHRPRCQMGIRYLSMSILVGCYNTTVSGVESSRTLFGLWSHLLTFKRLFDFVTVRCSSWIYSRTSPLPSYHASSSYIFSALVSYILKQYGKLLLCFATHSATTVNILLAFSRSFPSYFLWSYDELAVICLLSFSLVSLFFSFFKLFLTLLACRCFLLRVFSS